jgi:hypothetical protein
VGSGAGLSLDTPPASLTSLICHNSNTDTNKVIQEVKKVLSWNDRKRQLNAIYSIQQFVERHGVNNCLCVTLTTRLPVFDHKEWSRRFNSFNAGVLRERFGCDYIAIDERQKRGAWHTHLIVSWGSDVKTGYIFKKGYKKRSANDNLKEVWAFFRKHCPVYNLGEAPYCEPIRSNGTAIGYYYGKYISKGIMSRPTSDKGLRLVRYGKHSKYISPEVMLIQARWDEKMEIFTEKMGFSSVDEMKAEARLVLGRSWCFWLRNYIVQKDLNVSWEQLLTEVKMEKDGNRNVNDSVQVSLARQVVADAIALGNPEPTVYVPPVPVRRWVQLSLALNGTNAQTGVSNPAADNPKLESLTFLKKWAKHQRERDTLELPLVEE